MKKLVCTLLALVTLCSLLVVNASATNTYEGEMFEIVTDYEFDFSGGLEEMEGDEYYFYFCDFEDIESEIEIQINDVDQVLASDEVDSCKEYYELYKEYNSDEEEIIVDGIPAFVDLMDDDDTCYFVRFWSDNYYYDIDIEASDEESRDDLLDILIDGFRITDSTSWYESDDTDDKEDKDDEDDKDVKDNKDDKTTDEDEESESDDSTVIIIVAVAAGVVVLGVVAIVVLGKKKKQ